jgi:hypothetical protein
MSECTAAHGLLACSRVRYQFPYVMYTCPACCMAAAAVAGAYRVPASVRCANHNATLSIFKQSVGGLNDVRYTVCRPRVLQARSKPAHVPS